MRIRDWIRNGMDGEGMFSFSFFCPFYEYHVLLLMMVVVHKMVEERKGKGYFLSAYVRGVVNGCMHDLENNSSLVWWNVMCVM